MNTAKILLPEQGSYYKANLHAHTTISDGKCTPEELKRKYMGRGYSIVAFTDHNDFVRHNDLAQEGFVPFGGVEINIDLDETDWSTRKLWHFNFFCLDETAVFDAKKMPQRPPYGDIPALNAYIAAMRDLGFVCSYNHPRCTGQTHEEYSMLKGLLSMEIFNTGNEQENMLGSAPQIYDEMLRAGQRLYCLAVDDNHNIFADDEPLSDSFGGFTMMCCDTLSYAGVAKALVEGAFYASTGPTIHALWVEDGVVTIKTSPVERIYMNNIGRSAQKELATAGEAITRAQFKLVGNEKYFRITCKDWQGKVAYTNAYFLDEL